MTSLSNHITLYIVNLHLLPSPKYIYSQDYFFPHCIKEVSGLVVPNDTGEFGDIWDDDWLIFSFCFLVLLFASVETLPQDALKSAIFHSLMVFAIDICLY